MAQTIEMKDGEIVKVEEAPGWQNWKLLVWGAAMAVLPALTEYVMKIDWTQYFDPSVAFFVGGAVTMVLRWFSSGPAMSNVKVKVVN